MFCGEFGLGLVQEQRSRAQCYGRHQEAQCYSPSPAGKTDLLQHVSQYNLPNYNLPTGKLVILLVFPCFLFSRELFFKYWEIEYWPIFGGAECLEHPLESVWTNSSKSQSSTFQPPFLYSSIREYCTKAFWRGSSWHPDGLFFQLSSSGDGLPFPSERPDDFYYKWTKTLRQDMHYISMAALAGVKDPDKSLRIIEL